MKRSGHAKVVQLAEIALLAAQASEAQLHEAMADLDLFGRLVVRIIYRVALAKPTIPLWYTPPNRIDTTARYKTWLTRLAKEEWAQLCKA